MANPKPVNNNKAARGKNKKAGNTKLSSAETRELLAKQYKLRNKTKEFIDELIANPKQSATDAYLKTHETNSRITAGNAASKLLKSPGVIGYKDSAVGKAKRRIVSLIDSENESIALKASESVIDRNEGKAIQKSETLNRTVEVKLDLTGLRVGSHHINSPIVPALAE